MTDTVENITKTIKEKYPDIDLKKIEVDKSSGMASFYVGSNEKLEKAIASHNPKGVVTPKVFKESASVMRRDALDRSVLDLLKRDAYKMDPKEAYEKAIEYYYTNPLVGSTVNLLANLACRGFENDIDDLDIKHFFDVWCFDVGMMDILDSIFLDFFKIGAVHTYKVLAEYQPRLSYLSPVPGKKLKKVEGVINEDAARKKRWANRYVPVSYTVLNPLLVKIDGNLLFNTYSVKLSPPTELTNIMQKASNELTIEEKELLKILPKDIKDAATSGQEIILESDRVGSITYRKQPYERYARPRIARLFDSLDYKRSLQEADLSTLDGITNYILKITVGNDEFPVTSHEELEAVAQLFNTPSKAFEVVWNHTLQIEKIISPEIGNVLGKSKYEQVNDDLMLGLSIPRALIDGEGNPAGLEFAVKGVLEEVKYARRKVERWLYNEYRQIAEAVGFDRFPKVRWDEGILRDTILYMNIISQLVDRRMLSYNTALESLGFDFRNELGNMQEEKDLVMDGTFGIIGSPWQKAKSGGEEEVTEDNDIQEEQRSPEGTPSSGRPVGKPAKNREEELNQSDKMKQQMKYETKKSVALKDVVKQMSDREFAILIKELSEIRDG